MKKLYLKSEIVLVTPAALFDGTGDITDNNVLKGKDGKPYIPGSTLAGICRHYIAKLAGNDFVNDIFGTDENDENTQSKIIFYDAFLSEGGQTQIRDGVKIGKTKVAEDGAKYDYEVVNSGSKFVFRLCMDYNDDTKQVVDYIQQGINSGEIRVAAKKNMGFGEMKLADVKALCIDLETNTDAYINFCWDDVKDV